jgi:hypothetical protein
VPLAILILSLWAAPDVADGSVRPGLTQRLIKVLGVIGGHGLVVAFERRSDSPTPTYFYAIAPRHLFVVKKEDKDVFDRTCRYWATQMGDSYGRCTVIGERLFGEGDERLPNEDDIVLIRFANVAASKLDVSVKTKWWEHPPALDHVSPWQIGRATGVAQKVVSACDVRADVDGNAGLLRVTSCLKAGDSGSVFLDDRGKIVAMYMGVDSEGLGVATWMPHIARRLSDALQTAKRPGFSIDTLWTEEAAPPVKPDDLAASGGQRSVSKPMTSSTQELGPNQRRGLWLYDQVRRGRPVVLVGAGVGLAAAAMFTYLTWHTEASANACRHRPASCDNDRRIELNSYGETLERMQWITLVGGGALSGAAALFYLYDPGRDRVSATIVPGGSGLTMLVRAPF